jgi:hypothetical protein
MASLLVWYPTVLVAASPFVPLASQKPFLVPASLPWPDLAVAICALCSFSVEFRSVVASASCALPGEVAKSFGFSQ